MNDTPWNKSTQTLPLHVAFGALKVLSEADLVNGLDDWRASNGHDSLASFDPNLAQTVRRQPPTKFGHTEHPSLWTAVHFFLALPGLDYAMQHYGRNDATTRDLILTHAELTADFYNFLPIVGHYHEYQAIAKEFGPPTKEWWDKTLGLSLGELKGRPAVPDALELLPPTLARQAKRTLARTEDSLTGRIVLSYLLLQGYSPTEINLDPRVLSYLGPIGHHIAKSLYERLTEAQQALGELTPYLEHYDPNGGMSVGDLLAIVNWFSNPDIVEVTTPELRGADMPAIESLLKLFNHLAEHGGPNYNQPPLTSLLVEKFYETQSLEQIGRLSLAKDISSTDHHDLPDGAVLRRLAARLYSPAQRQEAWGNTDMYYPDTEGKRMPSNVALQDLGNILYCAALFEEQGILPSEERTQWLKQLAGEVKTSSDIAQVARFLAAHQGPLQKLYTDWESRYPGHPRVKLLKYIIDLSNKA